MGVIGNDFDSTGQTPIDTIIRPDLSVHYFNIQRSFEIIPFLDTVHNEMSIQYDPTRRSSLDYFSTGNLGAKAHPFVWKPNNSLHLAMGINAYDLYNFDARNPQFLVSNRMIMHSLFSQGSDQKNLQIETKFAHEFKPDIHFYLDYKRISNTGIYTNQKGKHTILGSGFWIDRRRWDSFIHYTSNVNEEENNGGVSDLTVFNDPFNQIRTNIPVFLDEAKTRIQEKSVLVKNQFSPISELDAFKISHQAFYQSKWFKYIDEDPNPAFYGGFHLDDRANRHFIQDQQLENNIHLEFANTYVTDSIFDQADAVNSISFDISIVNHWIQQEPIHSRTNDLFFSGKIHRSLSKGYRLEGSANYGFLDALNSYQFQLDASKNWTSSFASTLSLSSVQHRPSLIESQFILFGQEQWQNQFDQISVHSAGGQFDFNKIKLQIGASFHRVNNFIYFDESVHPRQFNQGINIGQIIIKQQLNWRKLGLLSHVYLQQFSESVIQLPSVFIKESLYFEGPVFKKAMHLKTGFDLRITNEYDLYGYQPLLGQFYQNVEMKRGLYPEVDAFLSFKVARFIAFVRAQNLYSFIADDVHFYVNRYPVFDFNLRFGVRWTFLD